MNTGVHGPHGGRRQPARRLQLVTSSLNAIQIEYLQTHDLLGRQDIVLVNHYGLKWAKLQAFFDILALQPEACELV